MTESSFDMAIVGGGIVGLTAAMMALGTSERRRVLLLDQAMPPGEATSRSAALLVPYATDAASRELMSASWALLSRPPLRRHLRDVPTLVVVRSAGIERLQAGVIPGPLPLADNSRLLALRRHFPDVRIDADEVVLDAQGCAAVLDVHAFARQALASPGLSVWRGCRVEHAARREGQWVLRTASGRQARAPRVIFATGAGNAPTIAPAMGEPPPVRVKRVAALHLTWPHAPAADDPCPALMFPEEDFFLLPSPHEMLASFRSDRWLAGPAVPDAGFDDDDLRQGLRALGARSPALAAAVVGGRASHDGYTPDRVPLVVSRGEQLVAVAGGSGSGVRYAPGLARAALSAVGFGIDSNAWTN